MTEGHPGRFITLEGGEGSGKSTQARLLAEHFQSLGLEAVSTREPGGTPQAEAVRDLLFGRGGSAWEGLEEVLLIAAARHAHLRTLIKPALARGAWVICDRFNDSTHAYQGHGHGVHAGLLEAMDALTLRGFKPDRTLLFDLPVAEGIARARGRREGGNRYDAMGTGFHERVAEGFRRIAEAEPERVKTIDAGGTVEAVHRAALDALADLLPSAGDESSRQP